MARTPPAAFVFDEALSAFLTAWRTASLATVDDQGAPHNANVQFVHGCAAGKSAQRGRFDLWWVSSPTSVHSQNLAAQPRAAVTVYAHTDTPDQIHGMQARGRVYHAITPDHPDHAQALNHYATKFPFVSQPPLRDAVAKQALYRFRPDWIRWIDNRRGFGWKAEHTLGN